MAAQRVEWLIKKRRLLSKNRVETGNINVQIPQVVRSSVTYPQRGNRPRALANEKCFRCRGVEHYQKDCKKTSTIACHSCGREGVIRRDCPNCKGNGKRGFQ